MFTGSHSGSGNGGLKLAWRVGLWQWETDSAFDRLLGLFRERLEIVHEAALFDSITHHLYIPLDLYSERMAVASRRLERLRKEGISSAGINVLCTIGHINEAWDYMPPLPFQPMVGHDGRTSRGCACPNSPQFRSYVSEKYRLAARARPDFIWVDDDIRMHHHGVAWGCFCPLCLEIFAGRIGRRWTREELVRAFDDPDQGRARELWVEQNIASIESLLAEIRRAVHGIDRHISLGLMTCGAAWTTYSGQAFERWFTALGATRARPGGGFYTDAMPREMLCKAHECGCQRAILPAGVTEVQYELENFPYQRLKKSARAVINECSLALAHGLNGVAFNMMGTATSWADFLPWMDAVPAAKPAWEQWVARADGLPTAGLWPAWNPGLMAQRRVRAGETWLGWHQDYNISRPVILAEIGIPLASDRTGNPVILSGRIAEAFSDAELRAMLAGGVLMDSTALMVIEERGLSGLAGARVARRLDNGLMERFTDDELNGPASGELRDARIEFWGDAKGMGDVLEPTASGARILSVMEDYFLRPVGPAMIAFENELGGRVVVMGYAPWIFLHSAGKRLQLQNAADWISRMTMPVRIVEPVSLACVARFSHDRRRGAVMLVNAGMDDIRQADVLVRTEAGCARVLSVGEGEKPAHVEHDRTGLRIVLCDIRAWETLIVLLGE